MKKKLVIGGLVALILFSLGVALAVSPSGLGAGTGLFYGSPGDVAVVRVEGVITGGRDYPGFMGMTAGSESIMEQLKEVRQDPTIKALVLRVNSPGGSAAASQEIGDEIKRIREAGKVVVASMGDTAASGGYWIAATADKIVANPATMTGSIGVIMESPNLEELFRKLGIEHKVIKSGPLKDMGSISRDMTPEEGRILQEMVDDIYLQFLQVVAEGRNLPLERVRELADGRIYTGRQAKDLGLVDELGNFEEALRLTASLANLPGEPTVREMAHPTPLDFFLSGAGGVPMQHTNLTLEEVQLLRGLLQWVSGSLPPVK